MKHILVFTTAYLPLVGGAEVAVDEITKRLTNKFRFTIITYRFSKSHPSRENQNGVKIIRLGTGSKLDRFFIFPFRTFWQARKIAKIEKIDLLWGVMVSYASIGAYFTKLLLPKIPFLLTLQEGDSEAHIAKSKFGLISFWWKRLNRIADRVHVISNYLKGLAEINGAKSVTVVPNGVDLEKYNAKNAKQDANHAKSISRFSNGFSSISHYTIITTSRLVYKNGIDTLIKAIAELSKKLPASPAGGPATSYKLRIVGDGPLRKELEHLTNRLNIEYIVEFVGKVAPEQIPHELANADIFVRPSRSEGLGISFLEAMAAGLPIIATNVGGIPDFLHPLPESLPPGGGGKGEGEANGFFCKVDDPKDFASKIKQLLEDVDLASSLGQAGRNLVVQNYNWNKIVEGMSSLFEEMISV